jgi:cell division protein FtsB
MNKLKNDIKAVKARNSQYKIENEQLKRKIKELENKIEALL